MTRLSVNLNAVAMLRNRRDVGWPSVTEIAQVVLQAGADGVTVHPRPDERHIRRSDVHDIARLLKRFPKAEFNVEGYPSEDFLDLVEAVRPHQVTLVPDDPSQATSDHGWDIAQDEDLLEEVITRLHGIGARVALFIDADPDVPAQAARVGADRVEIYTGPYGGRWRVDRGRGTLPDIAATVEAARKAGGYQTSGRGLGVNAGHDLTLENLPDLIATVGEIDEVSIGHGITADALLLGFAEAVRRYKAVLA